MAKRSQIDKAIADVDEKIAKVDAEWKLQEAKFKLGIETLCACKDVLVAMKRTGPKRKVKPVAVESRAS